MIVSNSFVGVLCSSRTSFSNLLQCPSRKDVDKDGLPPSLWLDRWSLNQNTMNFQMNKYIKKTLSIDDDDNDNL